MSSVASAGHTSTSAAEVLHLLRNAFLQGMTKWRAHGICGSAPEAAYYNLGAFSQSIRLGLTHATKQYRNILCRINAWLTMLFPLGTWSSICVSHDETLKIHRDSTNEPNTLNYTVTVGSFSGGGLLLESTTGEHSAFVEDLGRSLRLSIIDTRENPFAFDGNLWHGTAPFEGDRWVITAYTCRNLSKLSSEDLHSLRSWGFPLPHDVAVLSTEAAIPPSTAPTERPSRFCLLLGAFQQSALAVLASSSVPFIPMVDLVVSSARKQIMRCAAEGVLSTVFIRFSNSWTAEHNGWVLQLCKLAFSCGATFHLDISEWNHCWSDQLFLHCVPITRTIQFHCWRLSAR